MQTALAQADRILRGQLNPAEAGANPRWARNLVGWVCIGGIIYGAVMGCFGGLEAGRAWQILYSAAKVPLLLLGTFLICLPSFFVFNTVSGLRRDFGQVSRALLGAQAGMTLILCSLAPFTAMWYLSVTDYSAAVLFNGMAFAVASLATQTALRRSYQPLIARDRRHRRMLRVWIGLYIFVGTQLGWVLRPFVGQPETAVQWFRSNAWGNAYVEILHHLTSLF